jgi:hypothetical protein
MHCKALVTLAFALGMVTSRCKPSTSVSLEKTLALKENPLANIGNVDVSHKPYERHRYSIHAENPPPNHMRLRQYTPGFDSRKHRFC